jgi:hypothetical protein
LIRARDASDRNTMAVEFRARFAMAASSSWVTGASGFAHRRTIGVGSEDQNLIDKAKAATAASEVSISRVRSGSGGAA